MNKWMWVVIYKLKGDDSQFEPADYCTKMDEALAVLKAFEQMFLALAKLGQLEGYEMDLMDPTGRLGYHRLQAGCFVQSSQQAPQRRPHHADEQGRIPSNFPIHNGPNGPVYRPGEGPQ